MEQMVSLSQSEYQSLLKDAAKLAALEAAGVDNWSGYEMAMEMLNEEEE